MRRPGFTLFELMVSVSILGLLVGASYACLDSGLRAEGDVDDVALAVQKARVALDRIASDLRHCCPMVGDEAFLGLDREVAGMEADNVDFAARCSPVVTRGASDYCEISYYVARSVRTGAQALWRRIDATPDLDPLSGGDREEILDDIRGFRLEYEDGYRWHDTWGRTERADDHASTRTLLARNLDGLPTLVRVTIDVPVGSGGGVSTFSETVHVPLSVYFRKSSSSSATTSGDSTLDAAATGGADE